LYDQLLNAARDELGAFPNEGNAARYMQLMEQHFQAFPDDHAQMREQGLAYFRYFPSQQGLAARGTAAQPRTLDALIAAGH
ncbi:2-oxoadipate dioxygenase/decarboxylase family protein, partial [Klebsiella pneumoniae]|uniref:2-oxoadipate dioxygenase/decarboxylase family protein n=1 Tax=Klebsiella pneumoniae TaxID=573 RepID=UPI0027644D65|nr:DUF1338 domain-containing protein [Klebsiella pneumoniae]